MEPDFYQLFDEYRDEGYDAEQAEELAWKVIQGREVTPLSNNEYSAFLSGLANYLENPEEPERMERTLEIIQHQINSDNGE
jgi:hypothetical protein